MNCGYGDCGSAEARHLAPVLHWIVAEDPEPAVLAAVVAGSAEDQSEVQLREAIVVGSDSAEPGERGAIGAGESGFHHADAVYGV